VERLVAVIGCSGFVSFDFIVDADDRPWLLEMNPRPIGSTHLGRLFGHDLAHAFVTGEAGGAPEADADTVVALFPKELERDPGGSLLDRDPAIRHDVPFEEPRVVAAYLDHLTCRQPAYEAALRRRLARAGLALTRESPTWRRQLSQAWQRLAVQARASCARLARHAADAVVRRPQRSSAPTMTP
jgi:hypothetical protein